MGSKPSRPPAYVRRPGSAQLRWALEVLVRPPVDRVQWCMAWNMATTLMAVAHRRAPRSLTEAITHPGRIALDADRALTEIRSHGSIQTTEPWVR